MASFKKKVNVSRIVVIASIPVILVALVLAGFFTFRRTLARFSLDFYFPFYQAAKKAELIAAEQSLAMRPRQELAAAVEHLQQQNASLTSKIQDLKNLEVENEELRQIRRYIKSTPPYLLELENEYEDPPRAYRSMDLPPRYRFRELYAEVILRDPATWNEQFVISKGKKDGITPGDLVLSFIFVNSESQKVPECVVAGRVVEVSEHTAVVATVVNPDCRLSVFLEESIVNGTLVGNGTSTMTARISHLPLKDGEDRAGYASGEKVVTSGFSEQTPRGILVGSLTISPDEFDRAAVVHESGLYAEAWMKPAAQLDMIRFVVVLIPAGPVNAGAGYPDAASSDAARQTVEGSA